MPQPTSPQDDGQHVGVGIGVGMGVRGAAVANASADAVASPPAQNVRIRQGGNVQQNMLLSQVKPVYPADAKEARIQGVVILEALIGRDGSVNEVKAISGHPMLQQAAIDAVSQWKYKPTLLNGQPVEVVTTVTVNFAFQQ
jgi:protein TonB